MFQEIDQNVEKHIQLTAEELDYFHSLLEHRKVKRKTCLLEAGQICDFEAYVIKGCIRIYYMDENGFEVDLMFATEDWWVSDLASFSSRKPSKLFIQTLEDCELWVISFKNKEQLFKKVPKFERMFRLLVQRTHESMMNRLVSTISRTADERYEEFVKKYPGLEQRITQQQLAAYLGISAEFLSKIKARRSRRRGD